MVSPASPLKLMAVCSRTMAWPTRPVTMWNLSQPAVLPQRASLRSLRSGYRAAVISMRTKPATPMPWPTRPNAVGNAPACEYATP